MTALKNRVEEYLVVKARKENRNITIEIAAVETGINRVSLSNYVNNKVTRFDAGILLKLCMYFDCEPGDLLYIDETSPELPPSLVTPSQLAS